MTALLGAAEGSGSQSFVSPSFQRKLESRGFDFNSPYVAPSSAANSGSVVRTVQAPQQAMLYMACQGALRKPPAIDEATQETSDIGAAISLITFFLLLKRK